MCIEKINIKNTSFQKNINHVFKNVKHVYKNVSDVYEKCIAYMKKNRHQQIYLKKC